MQKVISELQNFVKIEINEDNIDLSIFENSTFKFFQKFEFGSNLILKDISKVTALKYQTVKNILLATPSQKLLPINSCLY